MPRSSCPANPGALYVRVGDTLHPVLNLASARLIAGSAVNPRVVNEANTDSAKRGPLLGIPGAPAVIAKPLSDSESAWTICDDTTTTLIAGHSDELDRGDRQPSILVTARSESAATTYLLYDGRRAEVDLRNPGVVWALRLDGIEPRPVSRSLLDAIPEAPPIAAPHIPDAGRPSAVAGARVGTVVRVPRVDSDDFFVVLGRRSSAHRRSRGEPDSRPSTRTAASEMPSVSPDSVSGLPIVDSLPVSTYPRRAGATMGARDGGVLCAAWLPAGPKTVLWMGDSLPTARNPIALAQADGEGPAIDSVVMPSNRSAYVRAASLARDSGGGPLYLVTDSGVLFGIRDEATAKLLGIQGEPVAAPWPVLSRLPRGPELNRDSALVARDSVTLPP